MYRGVFLLTFRLSRCSDYWRAFHWFWRRRWWSSTAYQSLIFCHSGHCRRQRTATRRHVIAAEWRHCFISWWPDRHRVRPECYRGSPLSDVHSRPRPSSGGVPWLLAVDWSRPPATDCASDPEWRRCDTADDRSIDQHTAISVLVVAMTPNGFIVALLLSSDDVDTRFTPVIDNFIHRNDL